MTRLTPAPEPAFPTEFHDGMSLRDWFAGRALTGVITKPDAYCEHHNIAEEAYEIADAMMKARES